jgi:ABC-type antimicrobial peptide transport system permease subunit
VLALFYFTYKDLLHDRWRTLLTIISLSVVLVGYLLLASLSQALVILSASAKGTNNLLMVASDTIDPQDSSLDVGVLQTALEIAPHQIQRAFPIIFRHLTIDGHILQVRAVPPEELSSSLALVLVKGSWPDNVQQVVVSEGAAQLAGWQIGSRINIYGTSFQVTGLVRNSENAFGSVWMPYSEGQSLFGPSHGFQVGYLLLDPLANPETVQALLQADPRMSTGVTIYLENTYSNSFNQSNSNLLILSSLMVLVSLLAVTFGIYNATSLNITERSREIGLLRVIGFNQGRLRLFLLARTLVLTLVAYGLGWAAALFFIYEQRLHASVDLIFNDLRLTPLSSLLGLALAVIFAFLGVWFVSKRLTSLDPLAEGD